MYPRYIADAILAALADTPVVLLVGPRQAGKSTLAQSIVKDAWTGSTEAQYITLDDAGVLSSARRDPVAFVAALQGRAVLDEVQRAPELLLPIKAAVDRDRRPGRFLLTGSANVLTLPKVADSLAGRMEVINLWPLSQGEIVGVKESFLDAVFAPTYALSKIGRAHV